MTPAPATRVPYPRPPPPFDDVAVVETLAATPAIGNGVVPDSCDVQLADDTTPAVEYGLGEALFPEPGECRSELVLDRTRGSRRRLRTGVVAV